MLWGKWREGFLVGLLRMGMGKGLEFFFDWGGQFFGVFDSFPVFILPKRVIESAFFLLDNRRARNIGVNPKKVFLFVLCPHNHRSQFESFHQFFDLLQRHYLLGVVNELLVLLIDLLLLKDPLIAWLNPLHQLQLNFQILGRDALGPRFRSNLLLWRCLSAGSVRQVFDWRAILKRILSLWRSFQL